MNRLVLLLYATVVTRFTVAGLPHITFSSIQFRSKLSLFLQEFPGMGVRRQGLFFATPLCESNKMIRGFPFAGRSVQDASRLLSIVIVLMLTGVASRHAIPAERL
jgi:hypothetical protein